jgi:hypothetical protein
MQATPGFCLECGATLLPVFGEESKRFVQFMDCLNLILSPGYGEQIDGDEIVDFTLCPHCSQALFNLFPNLKARLEFYADSDNAPQDYSVCTRKLKKPL